MDPRTQERVEQWDSRPFSGGYDGLADLADVDFSGAVTGVGTWLFMLNGRVVGVVDGTIEDFETASGTAYEAPDPALPLLCTMEERGGETRAKYYTNETPLREVDATLQDGSFTGYVELSENVLSGDYYAVYYGGRRMAVAYVGTAERLFTGEEAFERADDEVGIYTVVDVDIDVTDVPGTAADDDAETDVETTPSEGSDAQSTDFAAFSDIEADVTEATDAEVDVDSTASAVESIDLSGELTDREPETAVEATANDSVEDVTADLEIDVESSGTGITAADETASEPASSGVTDGDLPDTDATEPAVSGVDDADTAVIDEAVADANDADASSETDASATETDASPAADAGVADERPSEDDTEHGDSGPDPAEVEAAAEQLGRNDISWTEADVASSDDTETASDDSASTATAGSTARTDERPSQRTEAETDERFAQEAQWRETRSIPSIDPDNSGSSASKRASSDRSGRDARSTSSGRGSADATASGRADAGAASASSSSIPTDAAATRRQSGTTRRDGQTDRAEAAGGHNAATSAAGSSPDARPEQAQRGQGDQPQQSAALTRKLEALEEQRDALATKAERLEDERDRLQAENEDLSSTADRLRSRIEQLEAELERAREAGADGSAASTSTATASTQLSAPQALADTNLFVRYGSKSQPTLESARDGVADRSEVASNLQLEYHTGFDAADVAVDGEPYEAFLVETMEHRFVQWLTETLLFEIRDTGNADALADLYDAIPRIDRAEFDALISLADDETDDVPEQVRFDVAAFDKMGSPLVVANLNDSREPATQDMLEELEEASSAVKANYPDLAAAAVVTSSYFEPGALEVTERATGGGFLSRGSKLSYVNLSRKQGYHLCLVESRSEGFHMNVPEL